MTENLTINGVKIDKCSPMEIINGINVAECMYYNNTYPSGCYYEDKNHSIQFMECKSANCYYKENALLKEELLKKSEQEQSFQSLLEENAKLIDENKKLVNELVKHLSSGTIAKINAHKYVNVLQEINLIIDELKQQYDYMEDYSEIKEIEKKIKEVLA